MVGVREEVEAGVAAAVDPAARSSDLSCTEQPNGVGRPGHRTGGACPGTTSERLGWTGKSMIGEHNGRKEGTGRRSWVEEKPAAVGARGERREG